MSLTYNSDPTDETQFSSLRRRSLVGRRDEVRVGLLRPSDMVAFNDDGLDDSLSSSCHSNDLYSISESDENEDDPFSSKDKSKKFVQRFNQLVAPTSQLRKRGTLIRDKVQDKVGKLKKEAKEAKKQWRDHCIELIV